jgi:hypothetical protein
MKLSRLLTLTANVSTSALFGSTPAEPKPASKDIVAVLTYHVIDTLLLPK